MSDTETEYMQIAEDDYDVTVTLTVEAEYSDCTHCGLVLDEYQLLEQAGFEATFQTEGDSSDIAYDGDYGND